RPPRAPRPERTGGPGGGDRFGGGGSGPSQGRGGGGGGFNRDRGGRSFKPAPGKPSFEDKMSRFLKDSEERISSLKKNTEGKRGGRG
ncbi:RNA-binding protein S1, partial [Bacillus cereus]|nr:RNA-binding protein S1 [Bacillus cereus]